MVKYVLSDRCAGIVALSLAILSGCGHYVSSPQGKKRSPVSQGVGNIDEEKKGSLALTLPPTNPAFQNVKFVKIEMSFSSCLSSSVDKMCRQPKPFLYEIREFSYKPGENVSLGDLPAGQVDIKISLLNESRVSLFTGKGSATIEAQKTAVADIYVSPTQQTGNLEIVIKPNVSPDVLCSNGSTPGGYQPVSSSDPRIQKAAAFALKTIKPSGGYNLISVSNACYQVVAGTNYAFSMQIGSTPYLESHKVIVFEALNGLMTLIKDEGIANLPASSNP
jgi:hypothetical protein